MDKTEQLLHKIEAYRVKRGLNQKELCKRANIQPRYYRALMTGDREPSLKTIFKLTYVLDLEIIARDQVWWGAEENDIK